MFETVLEVVGGILGLIFFTCLTTIVVFIVIRFARTGRLFDDCSSCDLKVNTSTDVVDIEKGGDDK